MSDINWRKKRRSAEGSIKLVKGNLYARIQWIDETTGKRKEKARKAINRTDARKHIKDMIAELKNHGEETLMSDKMTFRQLAEDYEKTKLVSATYSNGIKISGKRSLLPSKSALKPLLEFFGRKMIRAIKTKDIEDYKTKRLNTPVEIEIKVKAQIIDKNRKGKVTFIKEKQTRPRKIASVNREMELLRAIFNFAKDNDLLIKSPFDGKGRTNTLIVKAAENVRDRVLNHDEEKRLLESCGERSTTYFRNGKEIRMTDNGSSRKHLRALIVLALDTGARRGELLKLRWKDVNLTAETITIRAENSKTEKPRTIGLTERAKTELVKLWEISPRNKEDLVFGIKNTIKNSWKSLCEIASIEDLHFHDLRHTATTRFIHSGVPHTEVMKITGHTQIKTFLRYLNLTNESVTKSARMLSAYLTDQLSKTQDIEASTSVN